MRPLLPFATLLGTAFLLGCQEQASSPVEPEGPLFDRPDTTRDECDSGEVLDDKGHCHADDGAGEDPLDPIALGEALFFGETFGGNGRTCGTCHRAENNLTIDVAFIATLHNDFPLDPLFIAERTAAEQIALGVDLPVFDDGNPNTPAFEDPGLMITRGLILENISGFELDVNGELLLEPPVFRAPPSLFNLAFTAPYGYDGNVENLRLFVDGAIEQHFTKTLARSLVGDPDAIPAVPPDFRLPTESELDALEAFMLSLQSPADGNFKVSGPNSILSTEADRRAQNASRPEVAGRDLFLSVGCTSCHIRRRDRAFSGDNFNTGVETLGNAFPTPTTDRGAFQTPGLFGLRKAAFFHNNAVGNNATALIDKTLQFTNLRDAVAFYNSRAFDEGPNGGRVDEMTPKEIDDITAFLVAISNE